MSDLCDCSEVDIPNNRAGLDLPEGIPALRSFYLYISDTCNLRCRHCWITPTFAGGKPSPDEVVDIDLLKQAVREARPLGLNKAKLTGGEPMIHPGFKEIALMLSEEGLSLNMETNGTLIDEDMAWFLKEETNIGFVSISLDSIHEGSHDKFRGVKGAYKAALKGLKHLVDAGYKNVQIIMSPHRDNVKEVKDLVQMAASLGAGSVKLNPVTNNGRGALMHKRNETLTLKEILELSDFVRGPLKEICRIPVIINIPLSLRPVKELVSNANAGDCGVDHILGILGSGAIALCGIGRTMPELVYGRLGEDSIRDIWLNHPAIVRLRKDLMDFSNYPELCRNCIFMRKCRTGCLVQNYSNFGKLIWPHAMCLDAHEEGRFPQSRKKKALS
ncbi:MAG TPA: radical SAM protein [Desulfomonilia bacterium]